MDLNAIKYDIKYVVDGKKYVCNLSENQHFSLDAVVEDDVLKVKLNAKAKVRFLKFDIRLPYQYNSTDRIFVNGYQSWTDSMEIGRAHV